MPVTPKITLVGAGPGDPELITLKGIRALRRADVVLYDALASNELLDFAPPESLKIYVGKRAGKHSLRQEEINELLVQSALTHGHAVRLKGGDPFVFGRGFEEVGYARSFGIEVEVVPGISSAIAVPGLQGVPLTHRSVSESFWVLTGTTKDEQLSDDLRLAAQSTATLVILMGVQKLRQIAALLTGFGKADLPAMVVQHGSTPSERAVTGTVATNADLAETHGIGTPGIIVVGEVVGLHGAANLATQQSSIINQQLFQ
ncbi:MAG: uroporphyrinogen-III C-methyltransferase [Bacteroidetes bacterium]|nr:uroporphyrinogen-III C-methyltransferase [Bacteroidota bacterium]